MNDPQTVGSAVAKRQSSAEIEAKLNSAVGWYDIISPSHMPARQLVALAVAELHKDAKLRAAAEANPASFMTAVAECARLGLVPGDKYHLVGFNDKNAPGGKAVTGITNYRGEMELAFRTGEVESIHCEVVRAHDYFRWAPTEMRLPEHRIRTNGYKQQGLADQDDRGPLTGVYAYARMTNGGISQCVVMPKSEVMKHRAVAKTFQFWGPEWPDEGPWTPAMWEKTGLHELSDYLPDSPEYMRAKIEQGARIAEAPEPPEVTAERERQRQQEQAETPDFAAEPAGNPRTIQGALADHNASRKPTKQQAIAEIVRLFDSVDGEIPPEARTAIVGVLANPEGQPLQVKSPDALTNAQAATAADWLARAIKTAQANDREPREALLGMARGNGWKEQADAQP